MGVIETEKGNRQRQERERERDCTVITQQADQHQLVNLLSPQLLERAYCSHRNTTRITSPHRDEWVVVLGENDPDPIRVRGWDRIALGLGINGVLVRKDVTVGAVRPWLRWIVRRKHVVLQ